MQQQKYQRHPAYKVWLSDLLVGQFVKGQEEFAPNYVLIRDKKISRVNIIGVIIERYLNEEGTYLSFILDDGSAAIKLKAWAEDTKPFTNIAVGTMVLVVGKVRHYGADLFIAPEIMKALDNPLWGKARRLELTKLYGEPMPQSITKQVKEPETEQQKQQTSVEDAADNIRQRILNIIEKLDPVDGADFISVIERSGLDEQQAERIINELIKEGEIYEIKRGKLKVC